MAISTFPECFVEFGNGASGGSQVVYNVIGGGGSGGSDPPEKIEDLPKSSSPDHDDVMEISPWGISEIRQKVNTDLTEALSGQRITDNPASMKLMEEIIRKSLDDCVEESLLNPKIDISKSFETGEIDIHIDLEYDNDNSDFDLKAATGEQLDKWAELYGIKRIPAQEAETNVDFEARIKDTIANVADDWDRAKKSYPTKDITVMLNGGEMEQIPPNAFITLTRQEEKPMNNAPMKLKVEDIKFINGQRASNYDDADLIALTKETREVIDELNEGDSKNTKPVKKLISDLEDGIKEINKELDERYDDREKGA